jgi:hypothetical protein
MTTSSRRSHPEPLIIPSVIAAKGTSWAAATQKVATEDAQRVLEALVAEFGLEATRAALSNQGFEPTSYSYLLAPLHEEAVARRLRTAAS